MAASANATIRSTFYHPQHMLAVYHYSDASTHPCAACERVVTGTGYRCDVCNFNIHKACFTGILGSISVAQLNGHEVTCALTGLDASQPCGICEETSHAGRYMYKLCAPASDEYVHLHPRCVLVTSTYFHPQHLLSRCYYDGDLKNYPCAVCERVVTGDGYRCGECDLNIHEACFSLPMSISSSKHSQHELTLTRLKASRWCDVCKETSHAGCYMYLCMPCNYDVHPRCVPLVDGAQQPRPQPTPQPQPNIRGGAGRAVLNGLHVVHQVAHTAHSVSSVVDTVSTLASIGACTIM